MSRSAGASICGVLLVGVLACRGDTESGARRQPDEPEPVTPADPPPPASEREFLEALVPLPGPGVRIVYAVDGPGDLDGKLEVLARPGGFRRENWTLSHPGPDGEPVQIHGSTIHNPDVSWSGSADEAGAFTSSALRPLARAYLELDAAARASAAANLRKWHEDLRRARTENPGDVREVAGVSCLQMRVAAQDLCLWEETGLALEYRGAEFSVMAEHVELDATFTDDAFEVPAHAGPARAAAPAAGASVDADGVDPQQGVQALVRGDYGPLAHVLTPGLRMPVLDDRR